MRQVRLPHQLQIGQTRGIEVADRSKGGIPATQNTSQQNPTTNQGEPQSAMSRNLHFSPAVFAVPSPRGSTFHGS
jgi:hypothetical protein